ncbi:hypothetical protein [Ammoniphilus sp. YIM 78166]|uniref:hypothetical protein n=1 Tax=Ammoniphilus sp. YIM 78166 TaxID=1644106 RepID=UPI00106F518E|nr:hypothetical protein [Ammoniphilus sp. YIM 78166]
MSERRKRQKQKFNFGDIVRVKGYETELFQIACFTSVYYHYPDALYKEYTYELSRIPDEEWLEAFEEELTLVCTAEQAQDLLRSYQAKTRPNTTAPQFPSIQDQIDKLLDDHITFMELYTLLGDEDYKSLAYLAFDELKELIAKKK